MDPRPVVGKQLEEGNAPEVFKRATEISSETSQLLEFPEVDAYVRAAEEAGIPRDATLQALRERLASMEKTFTPDESVFAKSQDGYFYPGKIVKVESSSATVRFYNGGEGPVSLSDLRPMSMAPGSKVQYMSPSMSMWYSAVVARFNRDSLTVTMAPWAGNEETVSLDKVRLKKEVEPAAAPKRREALSMAIGFALGGTVFGMVLEYVISHLVRHH